jgi:hypothetical protein
MSSGLTENRRYGMDVGQHAGTQDVAIVDEKAVGRRRMLFGGLAVVAAAVAKAVDPDAATAGHGTNIAYDSQTTMHLDVTNTTAGSTRISSDIAGTAAFVALNNYPVGISRPDGILGRTTYTTSNCAGVAGASEAATRGLGVMGTSFAADGVGVLGYSGSSVPFEALQEGTGVIGTGNNQGVIGRARTGTGTGVRGETRTGVGVLGVAEASGIAGQFVGRTVIDGDLQVSGASVVDALDVRGTATADRIDVRGTATAERLEVRALDVRGAATAESLGVSGQATVDRLEVRGELRLGTPLPLPPALSPDKLSLPKRSGVLTLGRAAASISAVVDVSPGSVVIATLQQYRRGLVVAAAVPARNGRKITIRFNRRAPRGTKVAWLVIN